MKPILKTSDLLMILGCVLGVLISFYYLERISHEYEMLEYIWIILLLEAFFVALTGRGLWLVIKEYKKGCAAEDDSTDKLDDDIYCSGKVEIKKKSLVRKIVDAMIYVVDCIACIVVSFEYLGFLFLPLGVFFWLSKEDHVVQLENMEPISLDSIVFAIVAFVLLLLSGLYMIFERAMRQYSLDLKKDIKLLTDNCEKMAAEIKSLKENSLK